MFTIYKPITQVQLVSGGNVVKQGHDFTLEFDLFDSEGGLADLSDATIQVLIAGKVGNVFIGTAATQATQGRLRFDVDEILPAEDLKVEFTIIRGDITQKFPADGWVMLRVTPSISDLEYSPPTTVTIEMLAGAALEAADFANTEGARAKAEADRLEETDVSTLDNKIDEVDTRVTQQLMETVQGESGKKVRSLAGVIRNVGNGFEFIQDATHEPMNLASLITDNTRITLNHGFNAKKVISLMVTPDETLASLGYLFGASVGRTLSYIYAYKSDDVYGYFTKSGGNSPIFTPLAGFHKGVVSAVWESASKRLVINHDTCYSPLNVDLKTRDSSLIPVSSSFSPSSAPSKASYVEFRSNHFVSGHISYTGGVWVVDPRSSGILTTTWDAAGNRLIITTENSPSLGANVTSMRGLYRATLISVGENAIHVQFHGNDGALITTPDTNMRITVSKTPNNKEPMIPEDGQVLLFRRQGGISPVNPNNITEAGGNIWIEGIMEVE